MEVQDKNRITTTAAEDLRRIATLAAAVRFISLANQLAHREQRLTVSRPQLPPVEIDFVGRQPFGFAFTEGHEATFHVPPGHRYVIEHMDVSCGRNCAHVDVELITRSPCMFRHIALPRWPGQTSWGEDSEKRTAPPIVVRGSSENTFLFSNGKVFGSSIVPPDTYVQIWGYLEPACGTEGF